jgi:glutaredoxin
MAIKLHRCGNLWFKVGAHPCWKVQKALDEQGVDYEVVAGPLSRSKRTAVEQGTGQRMYPAIQFEDGTWYREQSKDMAETIRAGRLDETRASGA